MISVKLFLFSFAGILLGCKNAKNGVSNENTKEAIVITQENESSTSVFMNANNCPDDGSCEWHVMQHTNLVIKEDSIGALYPVFETDIGTHVVKFVYHRKTEKALADSGYSEVIYLRIPVGTTTITLDNESLQDVGLLYGRLCFCRGASGYFPVTKGVLTLIKVAQGYEIALSFENEKVPQLINNLQGLLLVPIE